MGRTEWKEINTELQSVWARAYQLTKSRHCLPPRPNYLISPHGHKTHPPRKQPPPLKMETTRRPHIHSLAHRGVIQGVTVASGTPARPGADLCHYFGGVRYALAPLQRWRRARPLPSTFSYGTKDAPGRCDGDAALCPQPHFRDDSPLNPDAWNEDCFQCNVYVPTGPVPEGGWPVFFYIRMSESFFSGNLKRIVVPNWIESDLTDTSFFISI